jgi:hypothetical protein
MNADATTELRREQAQEKHSALYLICSQLKRSYSQYRWFIQNQKRRTSILVNTSPAWMQKTSSNGFLLEIIIITKFSNSAPNQYDSFCYFD